ncbi:MAG: GSCFA domain-containing protein [Tenacibaculum sp.]|nr:GSCFA domain-containing protein [Tenacibaculum sp.]
MDFTTKIPLKKAKNQINYKSNLLMLGSCFSENIGSKFKYLKFNVNINPFGILFNPKAIEEFISNSVKQKEFSENEVFYHNECWHSFYAHSGLSCTDKNQLLKNLNDNITSTNNQLNNLTHLIISLGTSWVYKHLKTNKIVANCHKVPQKEFSKEILSIGEITKSLNNINRLIHSVNKNITIIYTVSPIRHIKDGFIENQRSKSHLISAIHQVIGKNINYFPSYEIIMDELRDYRFYAEDMLHPNTTAINYIWQKFSEVWLTSLEEDIRKEIETIQKGLSHRPFNPNSEQHLKFINDINKKKEELLKKFPFINF